jgi:hypothetical protein
MAAGSAASAWLFGQATPEPWSSLGQYGAAGFLVGILIWRYERSLAMADQRAAKAEEQRDALTDRVVTDILPVLGLVNARMIPATEHLAEEVRRMGDRMGGRS